MEITDSIWKKLLRQKARHNRKWYVAYQMTPTLMTSSDFEGYSPIASLSSGIMSTVMQHDKISTETAHHVVSWFKLNWTELSKVLRPTCTKQVISETFFPATSWLATETQMSPRAVAYKILQNSITVSKWTEDAISCLSLFHKAVHVKRENKVCFNCLLSLSHFCQKLYIHTG